MNTILNNKMDEAQKEFYKSQEKKSPMTIMQLTAPLRSKDIRTLSRPKKKQNLISLGILIIVFLFVLNYTINLFSYFDARSMCYISIDNDVARGEQSTITSAIKILKKEDPAAYATLCKYVDIVSENECRECDPRGDSTCILSYETIPAGCYIKGTKVIYLLPEKDVSEKTVKKRANLIKKYAEYSKNFWENLNTKHN